MRSDATRVTILLVFIVFLLLSTTLFLLKPRAVEGQIPEATAKRLSQALKMFFDARSAQDLPNAEAAMQRMKDLVAALEADERIEDALALTDEWYKIREGAVDGSDPVFERAGEGFQRGEFVDYSDIEVMRYPYLISLPPGYGVDVDRRFPVIIFLHPAIEHGDLEQEVLDMVNAIYGGSEIRDEYIILAPIGTKDPADGRLIDAGKDWCDLHRGLLPAFTCVRLLLEQMVFDRTRVFFDGIGEAGLAAFRYATRYPGLMAGVIGRNATLSEDLMMENASRISFLYVSSSDNEESRVESTRALKRNPDFAFLDDDGTSLHPSERTVAAVHDWLGKVKLDLTPPLITMRTNEMKQSCLGWIRILGMNSVPDDAPEEYPWIEGRIDRESNRVTLSTRNITGVEIYLNDKLLNLDEPVTVVMNGNTRFEGRIERDLDKMVEYMFRVSSGDFEVYVNSIIVRDEVGDVPR